MWLSGGIKQSIVDVCIREKGVLKRVIERPKIRYERRITRGKTPISSPSRYANRHIHDSWLSIK